MLGDDRRHVGAIKRPPTGLDSRGQATGSATTVLASVPMTIRTLSGREADIARQTYAAATYSIRMWADPSTPILPRDYIEVGSTRYEIGHVGDPFNVSMEIELLCGKEA